MPRWMALGLVAILAALLPAVTATAGEGDAVEAFARGDYVAARRGLAPLGQAGDRDSQFYLGLMFRDGRGVPADSDTADLWFRLAASRGHLPSMVALGELGLRGVTSEAQADPALALVDAAVWLTLAVPLLPAGPDRGRVAAELQGLRPRLAAAQAIEVGRRTAAFREAVPPSDRPTPPLELARPFECRMIACDCDHPRTATVTAADQRRCRATEQSLIRDCAVAGGLVRGSCDPLASGANAVPTAP